MAAKIEWTRQQLLVAFNLYCQMPFGRMHSRNPEIIKYAELLGRTPSALAMKLTNIASLDPAIISTGRTGLTGASLADKTMWQEMQSDWERFALAAQSATNALEIPIEDSEGVIEETSEMFIDYTGKDKSALTKIRIGQTFFRRSVLSAYDYKCCITSLAIPKLLVAGHIVPWNKDEKNRLNPRNGLSLSMLHDKAFDIGLITIAKDFTVKVSKKITKQNNEFFSSAILAYEGKPIALSEKFHPQEEFLDYHRTYIFERG